MFLFSLLGVSPIDVFAELARVGVDYDDVVATLETDGVKTFLQSFTELLEGVRAKMHDTRGA
jgi:transaldolase